MHSLLCNKVIQNCYSILKKQSAEHGKTVKVLEGPQSGVQTALKMVKFLSVQGYSELECHG